MMDNAEDVNSLVNQVSDIGLEGPSVRPRDVNTATRTMPTAGLPRRGSGCDLLRKCKELVQESSNDQEKTYLGLTPDLANNDSRRAPEDDVTPDIIENITVHMDGRNKIKARFRQYSERKGKGYYISILPQDCPFRKAGLRLGDELMQISGVPLADLPIDTIVSMCEQFHQSSIAMIIGIRRTKSFCPDATDAIKVNVDFNKPFLSKIKSPPNRQGIILKDVTISCPMCDAELQDGDIILAIGRFPARELTVKTARAIIQEACDKASCLDVVVQRNQYKQERRRHMPVQRAHNHARPHRRNHAKLEVRHLSVEEDRYLSDDGSIDLMPESLETLLKHSPRKTKKVTARQKLTICGGKGNKPFLGKDHSIFVARKHHCDRFRHDADYPLPGDKILAVGSEKFDDICEVEAVEKLQKLDKYVDIEVSRPAVEPTSTLFQASVLGRRTLQEKLWTARERKGSHPINGPDDKATIKLKDKVNDSMISVTYSFAEHTSHIATCKQPRYKSLSKEQLREYRKRRPNFDAPRSRFIEVDLKKILHRLFQKVTEAEPSLGGKIIGVGSHHDGTKVGKTDELDFVYVLTHPDMLKIDITRDMKHGDPVKVFIDGIPTSERFLHLFYSGDSKSEVNSAQLYEFFTRTVDAFAADMNLPSHITYGGFDAPNYSGLRESGPAVTLLFVWRGRRVAVDLTLAVYSPKLFHDVLRNVPSSARQRLEHSVVPVSKKFNGTSDYVLLIPSRGTGEWRATTTCLEVFYLQTYPNRSNLKMFMRYLKCFNSDFWTMAPDMMLFYECRLSNLKEVVLQSLRTHMYKREFQMCRRRGDYETLVLYFVAMRILEHEGKADFGEMKAWWKSKLQEESDIFKDFIDPSLQDLCGEIEKPLVGVSSSVFKYVIMNMLMGRAHNRLRDPRKIHSVDFSSDEESDQESQSNHQTLPTSGPVSDNFKGFNAVMHKILQDGLNAFSSMDCLSFQQWADTTDRHSKVDPSIDVPNKCWHAFFGHPVPCRSYRTSFFGTMSSFMLLADKQYISVLDEDNTFAHPADRAHLTL